MVFYEPPSPIGVAVTIALFFILLMLHAKFSRYRETRSPLLVSMARLREIDVYRYPVPLNFFYHMMKKDNYTPVEVLEIAEDVDEKYLSGRNLLITLGLLVFLLVISYMVSLFFRAYANVIPIVIVTPILFGFVLLYLTVKTGNEIALKYDDMLKSAANEIIMEIMKIFKKNGLSGKDFPIKLRHNDYRGLIYEEKGKNDYIAYVVVE